MKTINYFFAIVIAVAFVACSGSEEDNFMDNGVVTFESMQSLYGVEAASLAQAEISNIPSVTLEEMQSVLEALRVNGGVSKDCKVVNSIGSEGTTKEVQMVAEYQARTRNGVLLDNFALCVSLNFDIDNGQVFYSGTDYTYSTDLFNWRANGLSLAPIKNSGYYGFDSTSYLYFRVSDKDNQVVRAQLTFNGKYNFSTADGTYSFALSKYKQ